MIWYERLVVGEPYFIVGFVDRKLTVPSIGTFVYMGIGTIGPDSEGKHCFQDAHSFLADADDSNEPSFVALEEASLDMVTDKQGLVRWLQSEHSTGPSGDFMAT